MDRKKAIIISVSVSFLVATVLFCCLYFQGKKKNQTNNPENQDKLEIRTPAVILSNVNDDNFYYVQDSKSTEEIKKAFDEYANSNMPSSQELSWNKIADKEKNGVPLDDLSQALDIKINDKISSLLNKNDYNLIVCSQENSSKNYGIVLKMNLFKNYPDLYSDEIKFMNEWESSMFKDLHNILFPGKKFSQSELEKEIGFKDGKYRWAKINSSDSIYYNIIDDYIIISASELCADKASSDLLGSD